MMKKLMLMCGIVFIGLSVRLFAGLYDLCPIIKKYTELIVCTGRTTESLYVQTIVLLNIITIFILFSVGYWLICADVQERIENRRTDE